MSNLCYRLRSNLCQAEASTSYHSNPLPGRQSNGPLNRARQQLLFSPICIGSSSHEALGYNACSTQISAVSAAAVEEAPASLSPLSETHERPPALGRSEIPVDTTTANTGMAVTWLGTSSGAPTRSRNVSSIALRLPHETLLVDCGEGTSRQLTLAGIHPLSVSNIFITHLHGDHCFGLIGMVELLSNARCDTTLAKEPLRIFGPPGILYLLQSTLRFSDTSFSMPVLVSEWTIDPAAARPPSQDPSNPGIYHARVAPDSDCQPTRSGSPRYPSDPAAKNPMSEAAVIGLDLHVPLVPGLRWTVPCNGGLKVTAAQLRHRVPCWGYVFKEAPTPPKEVPDRIQDAGLQPGEASGMLRQGLKPSSRVSTPSGKTLPLGSLFSPPVPGRKVVLLGDTCDSGAIEESARGANLVSHEATFDSFELHKARRAQHSTAEMAGHFCRRIGADWLFLTHFSARYERNMSASQTDRSSTAYTKGSDDVSLRAVQALQQEAQRAMGSGNVTCVQDFFTHEVSRSRSMPEERRIRKPQSVSREERDGAEASLVPEDPLVEHGHLRSDRQRQNDGSGRRGGRGGRRQGGGRGSSAGGRGIRYSSRDNRQEQHRSRSRDQNSAQFPGRTRQRQSFPEPESLDF